MIFPNEQENQKNICNEREFQDELNRIKKS